LFNKKEKKRKSSCLENCLFSINIKYRELALKNKFGVFKKKIFEKEKKKKILRN